MNNVAISLAAWLLVFFSATNAMGIELVRDGNPVCSIVVSDHASGTVRFAAQELQTYLKKISGADVPITATTQSDCKAVVIGTLINREWPCNMPMAEQFGEEGFLVKLHENNILLCGATNRAALYAAYSFIEQELGVRWFAPGPDGEVVPFSADVEVDVSERVEMPSFRYRYLKLTHTTRGREWGEHVFDWAVKNRLNVNLEAREEILKQRGGMTTRMATHSWRHMVPVQTYFAKHPEWYALKKGIRGGKGNMKQLSKSAKLCTTNPEVVKFVAGKVIEYFEEHPEYEVCSITQSDGMGWCECSNCTALDSGENWANGRGDFYPMVTDRMVKFANDILSITTKKFPKKYVCFLAYHNTFQPPVRFSPHPNVVINVVHSRPNYNYFNKPLDSSDDKHLKFHTGLERWVSYGKTIMVYDYSPHSTFMQLPFSAAHKFAEDIKFLKRNGVAGYVGQTLGELWGVYGLNYYVMVKFLWNVDRDIDAFLDDYFTKYYGSAAKPMAEFFRILEDALVSHEGMSNGIADYLSDEVLQKARAQIEQAKAKAECAVVCRRIKREDTMLHYGELFHRGYKLQKKFEEMNSLNDLRGMLAAYEVASRFARKNCESHAITRRSKLDSVVISGLKRQLEIGEKKKNKR